MITYIYRFLFYQSNFHGGLT